MLAPTLRRPPAAPPVSELLAIDRAYRRKARAEELPRIAPHRMNPAGSAWLPVYHETRGGTRYTALWSNTPRAHHLRRVRDWVVIAWSGFPGRGQATVVTEYFGPLRGRRVVRGREPECRQHYGLRAPSPAALTNGNGVV